MNIELGGRRRVVVLFIVKEMGKCEFIFLLLIGLWKELMIVKSCRSNGVICGWFI